MSELPVIVWLSIPAVLLLLAGGAELGARWWMRHRAVYYVFPPGLRLEVRPDPAVCPEIERRVRFDVNLDAANRVNLRLHSQLLKLARQVRGGCDASRFL